MLTTETMTSTTWLWVGMRQTMELLSFLKGVTISMTGTMN